MPRTEKGDNYLDTHRLDDSFGAKGARTKKAWLSSREGAQIEIQGPQYPPVELTAAECLRYRHTGFHEFGLLVDDIDTMFEKVRGA